MTKDSRIVITGFMASGKTTVAEELARLTGGGLIDLDRELTRREGRSVCAVIENDGEAFFRRLETSVLKVVLEDERVRIVALGGGAWATERNRALIAERDCQTVWLDVPFELSWTRINEMDGGAKEERPLARDYAQTKKLYEARRAFYALAQFRIDAGAGKTAEAIALEIVALCSR